MSAVRNRMKQSARRAALPVITGLISIGLSSRLAWASVEKLNYWEVEQFTALFWSATLTLLISIGASMKTRSAPGGVIAFLALVNWLTAGLVVPWPFLTGVWWLVHRIGHWWWLR